MSDEELAIFLLKFNVCKVCDYYNLKTNRCETYGNFICMEPYTAGIIGNWLKQPVEE